MSGKTVKNFKNLDGVFLLDGKFATENLTPGERVYGEELVKVGKTEYRIWDAYRSKPAAALKKKLKTFPLKRGMSILYLGAASGTTVSHFSDIVKQEGIIYAVDVAERVLRDLVPHAERRGNIMPVLADARKPSSYSHLIFGKVNLIFEDVASKDQVPILMRNAKEFLEDGGYAVMAIKSQSIDVTESPRKIYEKCLKELKTRFEILEKVELDPYEKLHMFVVMKYKKET